MTSALPIAAEAPPAGGAALDQVIIATAFGLGVTAVLFALCIGHRAGRIGLLAWGGRISERVSPLPGWAGVPAGIALVTLLPTLAGLQWDESLHIAQGRDEGPLANPSHYVLLQGIFGLFAAGVIALTMADDRVGRSGLQLPGAWRMPAGGVLATAGASMALVGFPLDDVWHRIYGQDVTLWSPTHVLMIAGMSVGVLGIIVLVAEGLRAAGGVSQRRDRHPGAALAVLHGTTRWLLAVMLPAALLLVVSLLQGEFDYGVPQYRLVLHPMIVMAAAGTALVAARIYGGRGAALLAVLGFVVIRGVIALLVGPVLGEPWHVFPLYLVEAGLVELVALRIATDRPLAFGLVAGGLIGSIGLAAEWAWSYLFPYPWPAALLPEAVVLGLGMALAGAVIGAWLGSHLRISNPIRTPDLRFGAVASSIALTAMIAYALHESAPGDPVRASVTLTEVETGPERTVDARITVDPAVAAEDAEWFSAIAWQGDGLISESLEETSPGVWETRAPLPVYGNWKSAIRLHTGDQLLGVPVFLPRDDAIPVDEVSASSRFTRTFEPERSLLQREAKEVASGLVELGAAIVAALCFALLGVAAGILHRLAVSAPLPRSAPGAPPAGTTVPAAPPDPGRVPAGVA